MSREWREKEREKRYIYKTTTNQKDGTKSRLAPVARLFASETSSVRELIITRLAVSFKKDETARRQFLFFIGHVGHAGQPSPAYLHTNVNRILCKFLFYFFCCILYFFLNISIGWFIFREILPSLVLRLFSFFFVCYFFLAASSQINFAALLQHLCVYIHTTLFFSRNRRSLGGETRWLCLAIVQS